MKSELDKMNNIKNLALNFLTRRTKQRDNLVITRQEALDALIDFVKSNEIKEILLKGIYTEEDVKRMTSKAYIISPDRENLLDDFDKWFELNKKK